MIMSIAQGQGLVFEGLPFMVRPHTRQLASEDGPSGWEGPAGTSSARHVSVRGGFNMTAHSCRKNKIRRPGKGLFTLFK